MNARSFRKRRVLVAGGLGFIGSNLVLRLIECGAEVTVVDSSAPDCGGRSANLGERLDEIRLLPFDLVDVPRYATFFEGCDYVFSLAGSTSHAASMTNPLGDLNHNCRSHLSLLEVVRRAAPETKIVVTSTRQVYGRPLRLPVDETHPLRPVDVNGVHQQAVEQYYRLYHEVYGVRSAVLRLTNTYGPRMRLGDGYHGLVAVFVRRALRGEPIELFGGGSQRRDFNYVDDVVDALLATAQSPMDGHEVYNLGHHEHCTLRRFAEILTHVAPTSLRETPFPTDRLRIDIGDYFGDYGKLHGATGWMPRVDPAEGLAATVAYYRERPAEYQDFGGRPRVPSPILEPT